jgi:hypothetical protein
MIGKKLDRVKQWAGEKMGGEAKTNVSDEFKALEMEMSLRHEGLFTVWFCRASLTFCRYGETTQIDDWLRQVTIEAY